MTITAFSGPVVSFGMTPTSSAGTGLLGNDLEHNPQRAPDVSDLGHAMMDPRVAYAYNPGGGVNDLMFGFYRGVGSVDYVPTAITNSASAFVPLTTVATGVVGAFTLAAASSANGTYSTTIIAPETGQATGTLIALESTAAYVSFGSDGTVGMWNAGAGAGRNITINKSSNLDAGTYTVAGRDIYGFKMTESITASASKNVAGVKAFKYISSITNCTTPTSTSVSIGFGDVFGLPLYTPYNGSNCLIFVTAAASQTGLATGSSAFVVATSSVTQTSTTADVRGTYGSSTATNGTIRLQITVTPTASAVASITSTNVAPLFGATQYSSV